MGQLVGDSLTVMRRNLTKIRRVPDLLVFTTLQPIMFVLLFGFVFGALNAGNAGGYRVHDGRHLCPDHRVRRHAHRLWHG